MSISQYLVALKTVESDILYFAHWDTDRGHIPSTPTMTAEEIMAKGVDGSRYLDDHQEFPEFTATTLEDTVSWDAAKSLAAIYWGAKHTNVQLADRTGSQSIIYTSVHVIDVVPVPRAGGLVGFGASSGSAAVVAATWKFRLLDNT